MNRRNFVATVAGLTAQTRLSGYAIPEPVLTRFPYIQNTRTDRASILWGTEESDAGVAEYSPDGVNFIAVAASSRRYLRSETRTLDPFTQYQANLTGLAPNTQYSYRVRVGQTYLAQGRFRTAGPGPFKFIAISDTGQRTNAQSSIARRIAQENPSFLLHAGDIAYFAGSHSDFQSNHFDVYNFLLNTVPFFPTPGNHEYETDDAGPYLAIHSVPTGDVAAAEQGRYYSFDWGNAHFICLDSNLSLQKAAAGTGDMLRWLERDLLATRQFWRIATIHHSPYAVGPNQGESPLALVRQYVVPILESHGVNLLFGGHEHSYQRTHPLRRGSVVAPGTGIVYVTTGGGGASLYHVPPSSLNVFGRSENQYVRAEVDGLGINLTAVSANGVTIDSSTIKPAPSLPLVGSMSPVAVMPSEGGSRIEISGRFLAAAEHSTGSSPALAQLAGTTVSIDDRPIPLVYVSPTKIFAQSDAPITAPFRLRVSNPNGSAETAILA